MNSHGQIQIPVPIEIGHFDIAVIVRKVREMRLPPASPGSLSITQENDWRSGLLARRTMYDVGMAVSVQIGYPETLPPLSGGRQPGAERDKAQGRRREIWRGLARDGGGQCRQRDANHASHESTLFHRLGLHLALR